MAYAPVVALDIGTTRVVALVGEMREDGNVMITGMGEHPTIGMRKGEIVDLENVKISVDHRTNSLLVVGPQSTLDLMEAILLRLDEQAVPKPKPQKDHRVRVIWLVSGLAAETTGDPAAQVRAKIARLPAALRPCLLTTDLIPWWVES